MDKEFPRAAAEIPCPFGPVKKPLCEPTHLGDPLTASKSTRKSGRFPRRRSAAASFAAGTISLAGLEGDVVCRTSKSGNRSRDGRWNAQPFSPQTQKLPTHKSVTIQLNAVRFMIGFLPAVAFGG